ncbi:MAG: response regulator [Ignavibacteriales bacterium]|jgi:CheY-like chemotaxis protein|nr:MAG: response regulator [Ignavibacteriales bacterium]
MALLIVIIAFVCFIIADMLIRKYLESHKAKKAREEREAVLKQSFNLDVSHEAKTLKRAEVENPKAKILAVDDEQVILDSFRKILVLDGYSVDTVETGQEALGLIQKHHYDFVFTDLKMPQMSGEDVCKSVKHLRPDIDVIIITGYATVESAVETMKYGAMDYVQKPFTEEELIDMVKKFVIKRHDRIQKQIKPKVHITHLSYKDDPKSTEFFIPGGVFISDAHCWCSVNQDGTVKTGIDDFAKKLLGKVDNIEMPNLGMAVTKDQTLFNITAGGKTFHFKSPITGKVAKVNTELLEDLEKLDITPYEKNWICSLDADNLDTELPNLKIGNSAVTFYQEEIDEAQKIIKSKLVAKNKMKEDDTENVLQFGVLNQFTDLEANEFAEKFFA